jgi:hypothetical protein
MTLKKKLYLVIAVLVLILLILVRANHVSQKNAVAPATAEQVANEKVKIYEEIEKIQIDSIAVLPDAIHELNW